MIKDITESEPALDRLKTEFERIMTDEQLRNEALSHEMWLHDQAQLRYEVGEERYQKGREEGEAQGELKARLTLAKKMKDQGFEAGVISELTLLTEGEIAGLYDYASAKDLLRGGSEVHASADSDPFCLDTFKSNNPVLRR